MSPVGKDGARCDAKVCATMEVNVVASSKMFNTFVKVCDKRHSKVGREICR